MRAQGFSVVKDAIPAGLIERLRTSVRQHFRSAGQAKYGGKFQLRGLHARPDVAEIILSAPVIEVIRRHVPPGAVLLTGECDLMMNTTSGWHKDITADMGYGPGLFEDATFGVYKLGIYLQDQEESSPAAFRVRPGSHMRRDGTGMREKRLATRAGDVVVFDVRIDHCGQPQSPSDQILHRLARFVAPALRDDPEVWFTRLRAMLGRLAGRSERLAVFLTFGPDAPATRAYEAAGRHRHGAPSRPLSAQAASAVERLDVRILDAVVGGPRLAPVPEPGSA